MKHFLRKILSSLLSLSLVAGCVGLSPLTARAVAANMNLSVSFRQGYDPAQGSVKYSVDGTTWASVTANQDIALNVGQGDHLRLKVEATQNHRADLSWTELEVNGDHTNLMTDAIRDALVSGDGLEISTLGALIGTASTDPITSVSLINVEFANDNGGGGGGGGGGNHNATIILSGGTYTDDTQRVAELWTGIPALSHDDTPIEVSYGESCVKAQVSINDGQRSQSARYDFERGCDLSDTEMEALRRQNLPYNREDNATTVDFDFYIHWDDQVYSLVINNVDYTAQLMVDTNGDQTPDTSFFRDRYSYLNHYEDQDFHFTITDVPVDPNEEYNIALALAPNEECFVGNFLWSNDDYFAPSELGGIEPNDLYIGHSTLTLLAIDFDDGDPNWDFEADGMKHFDVPEGTTESPDTYPSYVDYQLDRPSRAASQIEVPCSEMLVPEGSWVTMAIVPDPGYQVKSFHLNAEEVNTEDDAVSVFSFKVGKGNFHIGADVSAQEDEVMIPVAGEGDAVVFNDASVALPEGTLDSGSARLDVTFDANDELIGGIVGTFEDLSVDPATASFLDLALDQVFFRGTGRSDRIEDVWANPLEDTSATVQLNLTDEDLATATDLQLLCFTSETSDVLESATANLRPAQAARLASHTVGAADTALNIYNAGEVTIDDDGSISIALTTDLFSRNTDPEHFVVYALVEAAADPGPTDPLEVDEAEALDLLNDVYLAFLDRPIEANNPWITPILSGTMSCAEFVENVYLSDEFGGDMRRVQSLAGRDPDEKITDEEFIHILYSGLIGREPEDEEVASWMTTVNKGASWADLVRAFIMSDEFLNRCQKINASRGWVDAKGNVLYNKNIYYFVQNGYLSGLKRLGEFANTEIWAYMINSGEMSVADLPMHILTSPEYVARNTSDADFLTDLYAVALCREPDAAGYNQFLERLTAGEKRDVIIKDVVGSIEFQNLVQSLYAEEQ